MPSKRGERVVPTHYVSWSEQQRIDAAAPRYLRNAVRIITETGLQIYKELTPMKKDQVDLENKVVWIPDSKMPNGVADVPLTDLTVEALREQMQLQTKRLSLQKLNRTANEPGKALGQCGRWFWDSSATIFARKRSTRAGKLQKTAVESGSSISGCSAAW